MLADARGEVSALPRLLDELALMEEEVGRKGFDAGAMLGGPAAHEIRALTTHLRQDDTMVVASGDKLGVVRIGIFSRTTGQALRSVAWHGLDPFPSSDDKQRVIDALAVVTTPAGEWLTVGTRGNGAWMVALEAALDPRAALRAQQLPGSEGCVVRRLLADAPTSMLWASVENRLVGWQVEGGSARLVTDVAVGARVTALAIDAGKSTAGDHLYIATNLSTLHRVPRNDNSLFALTADTFTAKNAIWCGRSSVIETIIPLSRVVRYDKAVGSWVRRFKDRGVVATTLRHVMVMSEGDDGRLVCDVRRVAMYSKILAAAPVCLADWSGIAVATLEGKIRLFCPSGIRRTIGDFTPYREDAPENLVPRSLIGGYEEIEFLHERVYALSTFPPCVEKEERDATIILGMGDHTVRQHHFNVVWNQRRHATELGQQIVACTTADALLTQLESQTLHPEVAVREKYAASVLLPELGEKCHEPELWRRLKLLVWDILAGTDSPALQKVPVHVVQSLRRLQTLYPEKQEEIEQTITGIRKHIFDRESFSGKTHDFLDLTRSSDPDLDDDRVVYQSILISRRHDPVFRKRFDGEVRAFAALPPRESGSDASVWKFIVGTYRGSISVFDGSGNRRDIQVTDSGDGYVQAILVLGRWVVFAFSGGAIRWIARREVEAPLAGAFTGTFETIRDAGPGARSFATVPAAAPNDERFLWGDGAGEIHIAPYEDRVVARLPKDAATYGETAVTVLRSFLASIGGVDRAFLIAGTDTGYVHLFEWEEAAATYCGATRVGNLAVTALLVHRIDLTQVVVACLDGNVTGLWVVAGEDGRPTLSTYWAFRADDAVHDLQSLPLNVGTGNAEDRLIGVASHDHHIHVIDHLGRHLDAVYLKNVKLDRFAAVPEPPGDGRVECRIYGCAFENDFLCVRLISRREMLERLGKDVADLEPRERERRLTRWRAFAIPEGHLRHRFVRQSRRYPGDDADAVMADIQRLITNGSNDEAPTGVVKALLQRLFQNEWPGETAPPERTMGLQELLQDSKRYRKAVRLLRQLEERWDTPGSLPNRRVQYFWIRSLLRNIENIAMLRQWIAVSVEISAEEPLSSAGEILYHYLEHPSAIVQFKVLQCVERLLFGWPGVRRPGVLTSADDVRREDLEWLLVALLSRLKLGAPDVESEKPNLVLLQISKMLCDLVRIGCIEALYLAAEMQRRQLPVRMFDILATQCSVMAQPGARASIHDRTSAVSAEARRKRNAEEDARLRRAAEAFRAVARLHDRLTRKELRASVIEAVDAVVKYCDDSSSSPYSEFLHQTVLYYRVVLPLLRVKSLNEITTLPADLLSGGAGTDSRSFRLLAGFDDVIKKVKVYAKKKYEDVWTEPRLCALQFEDFDDTRAAWHRLSQLEVPADVPELEGLLFKRLTWVWNDVMRDEQDEELLRDLVEVVQQEASDSGPHLPGAARAVERLEEAEKFMAVALRSFLVRLVLFAQPERAALIHRTDDASVRVYYFEKNGRRRPAIVQATPELWPEWLDRDWSAPPVVAKLDEATLESWLLEADPSMSWKHIAIPVIGESNSRLGYFIFAWNQDSADIKRYESALLMWNLLLQSLIFRNASLRQEVLASRVFSTVAHNLGSPVVQVRTNARLLVDRLLENDSNGRFEKYDQILRQGRHMQGIIDAILSIDGRHVPPSMSPVSLAKLVHEVVRTLRVEAKKYRVTIDFKPTDEMIEETVFLTDEIRVYDILLNLVGNAVKYSPRRGTVTVKLTVTSHGAEMRIHDEGAAIPDEEKVRIFQPFVRGQTSGGVPGLGLGLYVVHLYTLSLKGRVQIHNEGEFGKSFVVYLPPWNAEPEESSEHAHSRG